MDNSNIPRTITIFLTSGNPNGVKKLEVSNRIIRAYVLPRIKLGDMKKYEDLTQPALYLLFDKDGTIAYIGESENFCERVKNHDQSKEFWDIAVAFIAKDKSLEKGDVKYLESLAVEAARDAKRMETVNKTVPPRNNLHEFKVPTIHEFFDDVKLLTLTLGYVLFDKIQTEGATEADLWYCRGKTANARGIYSEAGFTVLAGSTVETKMAPSYLSGFPKEAAEREVMLKTTSKPINDDVRQITTNLTFGSVSRASGFCLGRSSNGWTSWKNSAGKTLDEVIRKAVK